MDNFTTVTEDVYFYFSSTCSLKCGCFVCIVETLYNFAGFVISYKHINKPSIFHTSILVYFIGKSFDFVIDNSQYVSLILNCLTFHLTVIRKKPNTIWSVNLVDTSGM